ncbi:MAG TPA: formyltransferase family protein [Candidatus Paceibacterota bacterium]
MQPKLLVLASGGSEPDSGGSGFENLIHSCRIGQLKAQIVGVVCNHEHGGVRTRADRHGVRFFHFPGPWTAERYQEIAEKSEADFFACSGWLKLVCGLDPKTQFNSRTVFNIHPGLLPQFGGPGMWGHHVHEAVMEAYRRGEITHSGMCMHFVTEQYDRGPVFCRREVTIKEDDTPDTLGKRVNECEHEWQPIMTNRVVHGQIRWDGKDPRSLVLPLVG